MPSKYEQWMGNKPRILSEAFCDLTYRAVAGENGVGFFDGVEWRFTWPNELIQPLIAWLRETYEDPEDSKEAHRFRSGIENTPGYTGRFQALCSCNYVAGSDSVFGVRRMMEEHLSAQGADS